MRKLLALGVVLVALAGSAAAAPNLTSFRGTVVGVHGGTLLVALPSGTVRAIAGHARIGTRISFGGGRLTVLGHAHRALIKGVVVKRRANLTFLSAANHVLLVRTVRTLGSARDTRPAPGSLVQTTVAIDDQGELDEQNEEVLGHQAEAEVQAVVTAVGPGSVTLTVNGQPLVIPLPAGLTLPPSTVGTQVALKVDFGEGVVAVAPGGVADEDNDNAVTTSMTTTTATVTSNRHDGDRGGDGGHDGGADH